MQQTIKCPYCSAELIVTLDREAMNYSINKHLDVEPHKTQYLVNKQQIAFELSIQYFQIIRGEMKP